MTIHTQPNLNELIRTAEQHHEHYLRSLRDRRDGQALHSIERADSGNIASGPLTPPLRALIEPVYDTDHHNGLRQAYCSSFDGIGRARSVAASQNLNTSPDPNGGTFHHHDEDINFIPLLDCLPTAATVQSDVFPGAVQRTLTPMHFTDDMLLRHLRDAEFSDEVATLLDETMKRRVDIDLAMSFRDFASFEREGYVSSTFEVYEIGKDALATKLSADLDTEGAVNYTGDVPFGTPDGIVDAPTVWETIRTINIEAQSVGHITIVQEPTPLMLASLHLKMSPYFDMSELLSHLLTDVPNRGRTQAFTNRAFEKLPTSFPSPSPSPYYQQQPSPPTPAASFAHIRQRSFFFVFKYYTAVGPGLEPAPWQRYDNRPPDRRAGDHIDIAECGSILALSLGGESTKPLRMRPRRERARNGFLFDTFGPWNLLSIESFPDDEHTVRSEDFQQKHFYNGPYAFLELLIAEYRDAIKRHMILHERITKLITPPTQFMFDPRLRDKLLFEDKHFTYIRRYFWAYNTLAVINNGLKSMMAAYLDTFTEDFWAGTHPLLWPHPNPQSQEGEAYRDRMAVLRRELDKVVRELGDVLKRNERTRKEIENLRDQLFSGSSIKESRRAIEQGDNICILTMISMIFLPLTFVTSVFGITEFHIPATDWRFAVTMVLVCVPFMIIVVLLQTRAFTLLMRKLAAVFAKVPLRFESHTDVSEPQLPPLRGRKRRLVTGEPREVKRWKWRDWVKWTWTRGEDVTVDLDRVERG